MIVIAQPYAYFTSTISNESLERAAARLLLEVRPKLVKLYAKRSWELDFEVYVEQGSTRTWIKVSAAAFAVLVAYGDIRQSLDYLIKDAKAAGDVVFPLIGHAIGIDEEPSFKQRRLGIPGQLKRLFDAVEQGRMSASAANEKALHLLQHEVKSEQDQDVLDRIHQELMEASDNPKSDMPLNLERPVPVPSLERIHQGLIEASDSPESDKPFNPERRAPVPGPSRSTPLLVTTDERRRNERRRNGVRARMNAQSREIELVHYTADDARP